MPIRLTADTVYFDDFNRVGALTGSQPTVNNGGSAWSNFPWSPSQSTDTLLQTDGNKLVFPSSVSATDGRPYTDGTSDDREPSLAFTAPATSLVTLSAYFTVTSGSGPYGGFLGLGFIDDGAPNPGMFSTAGPFLTLSMDGSVYGSPSWRNGLPTVLYSSNIGSGATNVHLEIVYDTRNQNDIRSTFFVNGAQIGEYSYGSSGVSFDHAVLRSYLLGGGYVDNFRLSTNKVPDASNTLGLLGLSILSIALLRRRFNS